MANLTMDLTASNKNYKDSKVFRISKQGQLVDFETAVHPSSLHVYLISGGVNNVELILNTDYEITADFISSCDNDLSSAKLLDGSFDGYFIRGIKMLRGVELGSYYTISVEYQRLYPNQLRTQYYHNEPLEITPELMYDVVRSIENLKLLTSRVTDVSDFANNTIILEPDPYKTNTNNDIVNEEHSVDVANGKYIVAPKAGGYYLDSLSVEFPSINYTLVKDKDYFVVGMDEAKTKAAVYPSPVYKYIAIVTPISGSITINYHAYGGEPTIDNYRTLHNGINNIIQFLNGSKTITEDNLGSTEILTSLYERVEDLEARVRRLQGTPAYGDITDGKACLLSLLATTTGIHWYTIASLYLCNGDNMAPSTADTFIFRLQSLYSHFQFTAAVSVDLGNNEGDRFNVNIISDNYPRGYIPFRDYSNVSTIIRPQLRVVWNESDHATGAYLQLGFELKGLTEEKIAIEDMSGHESCWKLIPSSVTAALPQDTDFTLPNGTSIWSTSLEHSKQETMLVPFRKGILIWNGSKQMNEVVGWDSLTINDSYLDPNTNIDKFTKLRVGVEESDGLQFPVDIPFHGYTHLKGHASFTYQDQPAYINAEIYREDGNITIRLNYDITAMEANPIYIKDLVIFL